MLGDRYYSRCWLQSKGSGGETESLDLRTAFEDLLEEKKVEIKNYVGMNTLL